MLALVIVCIGIGSAGSAAFRGDRFGCAAVAVLGVLWLGVNKPVEGVILVQLSLRHGVTTADMFSFFLWALAVYGWHRVDEGPGSRSSGELVRTRARHQS